MIDFVQETQAIIKCTREWFKNMYNDCVGFRGHESKLADASFYIHTNLQRGQTTKGETRGGVGSKKCIKKIAANFIE